MRLKNIVDDVDNAVGTFDVGFDELGVVNQGFAFNLVIIWEL